MVTTRLNSNEEVESASIVRQHACEKEDKRVSYLPAVFECIVSLRTRSTVSSSRLSFSMMLLNAVETNPKPRDLHQQSSREGLSDLRRLFKVPKETKEKQTYLR